MICRIVARKAKLRSAGSSAPEASTSAIAALPASTSPSEVTRLPSSAPIPANASSQATSDPRCSRSARPHTPPASPAVSGPGRGLTSPCPKSRRLWRANATATSATARASAASSGHGLFSLAGRVSSSQPSGVSQRVHSGTSLASM